MTLRADVEALAGMVRSSAAAGERESAAWIAERLRSAGAEDVAVVPYRGQTTYAHAHAAHAAAGLLALRLGGVRGAALAIVALAGLELDVSGRAQPLRRVLPSGEGANVTARVAARGERRATLVVVAHHDAANTGIVWHPAIAERAAHPGRRSMDGFLWSVAGALGLAAAGALGVRPARAAARALLATSLAADLNLATSPTVPGASDNATGVAALLALAERWAADPLDGVEVLLVAPGSEESGMAGFGAWLAANRAALDARSTLVLGVDTLGSGRPIVAGAEGGVLRHRYRPEDLALADAGAELVGLPHPERWTLGGWTDPVLAMFAGLPAISVLSIGPKGIFTRYHRMDDLPEHVDWASAEACLALADGTARAFALRAGAV